MYNSFTNCTVTVSTVKMGGLYLNRVRVWDSTGEQLVAMRIWSDKPFEKGMLLQMQPSVAPRSAITLSDALAVVESQVAVEEAPK